MLAPRQGRCQHRWVRKTTQSRASERKFQSRRKLEASAQKKAEIYLIEFPSVSTSLQKPLSKATNKLCASWGPQGEILTSLLPTHCQSRVPRAGWHRVICLGRRSCSEWPAAPVWGATVSKLCPRATAVTESPQCTPSGPASASACLRAEPQQSWRACDAPQAGLLLQVRVSEC